MEHESLGENIIPRHYVLEFEPDLKTFKFEGKVTIEADSKKSTNKIKLNSSELKISKASIENKGKKQPSSMRLDEKEQLLTLSFKKAVSGKIRINVEFSGENNDKLYGFYRSMYENNGKKEHILTTQFEAAQARNAFPCFDEPSFKATFDLTLKIEKNLEGLSNMPIREQKTENGKKVVEFYTTPKMSTYLLYIGVGKFERTTRKLGKTELGIVTVPGKRQFTKLPLDYCYKFLSFFESYFGIKYPLPKLDLIAVPDFAVGAMENWGAITFREIALLGDENTSVATKQRIAEVIAHELAHMWFGDLVTMKWWDDLWLNESFATFMSYKAMDAAFPQWNVKLQYLDDTIGTALSADQYANTQPISTKIRNPGDIEKAFSHEITYSKGGSVLTMIEDYVNEKFFRKGLSAYLTKHSYSNATKSDLWGAIDQEARKKRLNVIDVADSWIKNEGYPSLIVKKTNGHFELTQQRFILSDKKGKENTWLIPIKYATVPGLKPTQILMKGKRQSIKNGSIIKLNFNQTGFYRTIYPREMLDSLGELVRESRIGPGDAWGIESDLYSLTKKQVYIIHDYLSFVRDYCFAAKYPMNLNVIAHLRSLLNLFYDSDPNVKVSLERLLREYSAEIIKQVGWIRAKDESNITTMMRSAAIFACGFAGDHTTIKKAGKLFDDFTKNRHGIEPNIRAAVYNLIAWNGDARTYALLEKLYKKEKIPEEKRKFLVSLGMFRESRLLKRALEFSLSKDVRIQDSFVIPAVMSSNPYSKDLLWDWTKQKWPMLMKRFPMGTHFLDRYVDNTRSVRDQKTANDIKRFFSKKSNRRDDITKSIDKALEIIEVNSKFIEANSRHR